MIGLVARLGHDVLLASMAVFTVALLIAVL
jgi:hypothetical protein